jgi:hypothetical protein
MVGNVLVLVEFPEPSAATDVDPPSSTWSLEML